MNLAVKHNIYETGQIFSEYIRLSKKTPEDALSKQARELAMDLFFGFQKVRPTAASIGQAAEARGYATNRKASRTIAKVDPSGVSAAAMARAKKLLAGAASDFFRVTDNEGVPQVRLARVGVRNQDKLLKGGRFGNKFAKSARGLLERFDVNSYQRALSKDQNQAPTRHAQGIAPARSPGSLRGRGARLPRPRGKGRDAGAAVASPRLQDPQIFHREEWSADLAHARGTGHRGSFL